MILPSEKRRELLARLAAAGPSTSEELAAALSWGEEQLLLGLRALELAGEVVRRRESPPPLSRYRRAVRWQLAS